MAVLLKKYNLELWINGGGIAAPAENRRFPPILFVLSRQIRQFSIIWEKLFFKIKISLLFALDTFKKYIERQHTSSKTTLLFSCIISLPLSCRSLYLNFARKGKNSAGNCGFWREQRFRRRYFTVPYFTSIMQLHYKISVL